jgi:hypothetical protein
VDPGLRETNHRVDSKHIAFKKRSRRNSPKLTIISYVAIRDNESRPRFIEPLLILGREEVCDIDK